MKSLFLSFVVLHKAVFHSSLITCRHGGDIDNNFDDILVKVHCTTLNWKLSLKEHDMGITDPVPQPGRQIKFAPSGRTKSQGTHNVAE